jgi:hypothetical protein
MMEKKIDLDDYVDDLPLGVASYRNKIKIVLKDFAKELLELTAENAKVLYQGDITTSRNNIHGISVNKQSILDIIKQIV